MPKAIKILHITYNMGIGGTEQVIRNLINGVQDERYQHSIFCIESPVGPWGRELAESGITVTAIERKPGFDTRVVKALRKHIQSNDIDIVHCHQYTPYTYGVLASLFTRAKVIFTEHGRFYPDRSSWKRRLINPVLNRFTHAITAISKATRQALVEFEFFPNEKVQVIYNGIADKSQETFTVKDLKQELGINEGETVLGTISRLDPIKNQELMLKAFAGVLQNQHQTRLLIVGDGPMRDTLQSLSRDLKIEQRVIFTGYQPSPLAYLALIDIYLLPSLSEGTSMTLLEAMSFSKPCIVTDVGGNPEIVANGNSGVVIPNKDQKALVEAVLTLMDDDKPMKSMRENARQRFLDGFTVEKMAEQYMGLYDQLCSVK